MKVRSDVIRSRKELDKGRKGKERIPKVSNWGGTAIARLYYGIWAMGNLPIKVPVWNSIVMWCSRGKDDAMRNL